MVLLVFGLTLIFFGWLISLTIIGALLGVPMMLLGSFLATIGMVMLLFRRKTVITNVVQVTNTPHAVAPNFQTPPRQSDFVDASTAQTRIAPKQTEPAALSEKNCSSCNASNSSDSRFCTNCGASLSSVLA